MSKKILPIITSALSSIILIVSLYLDQKIGYNTVIPFFTLVVSILWYFGRSDDDHYSRQVRRHIPITYPTNSNPTAKPKSSGLTLSSVSKPVAPVESASTLNPSTEQLPTANATSQPKPIELSDVEKELNYAKSISDIINELTIQIKRTEKNKTDSITKLKQSEEGLKTELKSKEIQLEELSEKLHSQPALRALINIKKTFSDIPRTKKTLTTEEVIKFVVDTVDSKLIDLDIQKIEFPEGTKLSDIPFDQIDTSGQSIAAENESQNNTVAHLIAPCYYVISNSKKVIIQKAIVSLYRFTPPSPQPQISQI